MARDVARLGGKPGGRVGKLVGGGRGDGVD